MAGEEGLTAELGECCSPRNQSAKAESCLLFLNPHIPPQTGGPFRALWLWTRLIWGAETVGMGADMDAVQLGSFPPLWRHRARPGSG